MRKENKIYCSPGILAKENKIDPALEFVTSKDQYLVPVYQKKALHSRYFPLKEGEKYQAEPKCAIIAIGVGGLYHLVPLAQQTQVIAISIQPSLTCQILETLQLEKLFPKGNLKIITCEELLQTFPFFTCSSYQIILHPVLSNLFVSETNQTLQWIQQVFNPQFTNLKTQRIYGKKWLKNAILNLSNLENFCTSPLSISNKVILVCGAGSSLEKTLPLMRKHRVNIYLAAADTALPILTGNKLIPDAVFSMDTSPYSCYHFAGLPKNISIRVFQDYTSSLRQDFFPVSLLFSNFPLLPLCKISIDKLPQLDTSPGNIGTSMLLFFRRYFPQLPLICTGIDFGFYQKITYSKGSYHEQYRNHHAYYFSESEQYDAKLYYRQTLEHVGQWNCNSQNRYYAAQQDAQICTTLSTSPFIPWKKIDTSGLEKAISTAFGKSGVCLFSLPDFPHPLQQLSALPEETLLQILAPYFLSINQVPNPKDAHAFLNDLATGEKIK